MAKFNAMNKAIVFNCSYNGLSIIQELGGKGIPCIALDCIPAIGVFSKYATFKKCPNPLKNESDFIEYLLDFCTKQDKKPVLFPTNDEWARVAAKYKEELQKIAYPCVGDFEIVDFLLDKSSFYETGARKNYMTSKIWSFEDSAQINEEQFPIVGKAKYKSAPHEVYRPETDKKLKNNRFTLINNALELKIYRKENVDIAKHLIFQEYVAGMSDAMLTVGIYANEKHEIKALFTGKKVRGYPADIGDNVVGESCNVPNAIIDNTLKIAGDLKYSGIAEFEYKKDRSSEEYRLIEINPRSWSWIGITPNCGVSIPLIAYNELTGRKIYGEVVRQSQEHIRYIKLYQDFINCLFRYKFSHPEWSMSFKEWYKEIRSTNNVYAEWGRNDYLISFLSIFYVIAKILKEINE